MKTFAEQDGDDFVLNGSKVFITGGINADMVLVCARTDKTAAKAAHGISIFCVDTNLPGFKKGRNLRKIGLEVSSITSNNCLVFRLRTRQSFSLKTFGYQKKRF